MKQTIFHNIIHIQFAEMCNSAFNSMITYVVLKFYGLLIILILIKHTIRNAARNKVRNDPVFHT